LHALGAAVGEPQEAKEKAKVKKRGLYDSSAASEKVPAAKAIFRQSCIHDQVTYNHSAEKKYSRVMAY
jgi:hypothetical protein